MYKYIIYKYILNIYINIEVFFSPKITNNCAPTVNKKRIKAYDLILFSKFDKREKEREVIAKKFVKQYDHAVHRIGAENLQGEN